MYMLHLYKSDHATTASHDIVPWHTMLRLVIGRCSYEKCSRTSQQAKLDDLLTARDKLSQDLRRLRLATVPLKAENATLKEELYHIKHTTDRYTDTDKVCWEQRTDSTRL